jgi:hypothetical protein
MERSRREEERQMKGQPDSRSSLLSLLAIGGNDLETAPPSRVADFVKSQGGHSVISKARLLPSFLPAFLLWPSLSKLSENQS